MSDDLVERLKHHREKEGGGFKLINPDGPESADRIKKLETALREISGRCLVSYGNVISLARKALEGKKDE